MSADVRDRWAGDQDHDHGSTVAARAGFPRRCPALGRVGFLMLHPLGVHLDRTALALSWLRDHGFRPIFLLPVRLGVDQVNRVWRYEIPDRDPLRVDVFRGLLTWDAALAVGVAGEVDPSGTVVERLGRLKGPSDPAKNRPGQLRAALGGANLLNNLVHASDAEETMVREAFIILGQRTEQFWRAARRSLNGECLDVHPPAQGRRFDDGTGAGLIHVGLGFRGRLIHALLTAAACESPRCVARVDEVRRRMAAHLAAEREWLSLQDPQRPVDVLQGFRAGRFPWLSPLSAHDVCQHRHGDRRVVDLLSALHGTEAALVGSAHAPDPRAYLDAAVRAGVPADQREWIALLSEYASARVTWTPRG